MGANRSQTRQARICSAVTGSPAASPSIPSKPEPIHTPRRLASLGVVRRQPRVTFLGRIQGRDLPGQVVIPRARCELMMLIVTPTRRGTCR